MKGFWSILLALIVLVLLFVVLGSNAKEVKKRAQRKKEALLKEKERLRQEILKKEKLRETLNRKFKAQLNIGYVILLTLFAGSSVFLGLIYSAQLNFESALLGATMVEIILLVATLFIYQKPEEFKALLTKFAPLMKKRVFGDYINIDEDLNTNHARIAEIVGEIVRLNKIIG